MTVGFLIQQPTSRCCWSALRTAVQRTMASGGAPGEGKDDNWFTETKKKIRDAFQASAHRSRRSLVRMTPNNRTPLRGWRISRLCVARHPCGQSRLAAAQTHIFARRMRVDRVSRHSPSPLVVRRPFILCVRDSHTTRDWISPRAARLALTLGSARSRRRPAPRDDRASFLPSFLPSFLLSFLPCSPSFLPLCGAYSCSTRTGRAA